MNKKILFAVIAIFLLLAGCGNQYEAQQNQGYTTEQQNDQCTITTSDTNDYNQYVKKVWVVKDGTDNSSYNLPSFRISKIVNGEIKGKFYQYRPAVPNYNDSSPDRYGVLTGAIDNGIAECQFSDEKGNKGNIKLVFKANNEIEATIKYTDESQNNEDYHEGTFQFRQYNFNDDKKEVSIIEDKTFAVDLNSWGNVRFVSTKTIGRNKNTTDFYLTDEDGDILYDFGFNSYNIDVNEVSFQDVNKDGLKDIIIIIGEPYYVPPGSGKPLFAAVLYQKTDGEFDGGGKVYLELNHSGNYKDAKTVTNYLSKKY